MDAQTLAQAMGNNPQVDYQRMVGPFNEAMIAAEVTNTNRAAMWIAQIGHESAGLRWMEEIASGAAYEGRADLGNTQPGDGTRFKGSGPIQLTGRANFRAFTRWANANGHTDIDFEARPELVRENPKWGFLAASWYWVAARSDINALSDRRDLETVTRRINGGLNGLADRRERYSRALSMGDRILPSGGNVSNVQAVEKRLDYPRDEVHQDTGWNCGPASVQTVVRSAKNQLIPESTLARELGTHRGGTDWIGSFPGVLNKYIPEGKYRSVEMPNDPPTNEQRKTLWENVVSSIDAGFGIVANIVAPPSNYPRASYKSTQNLQYSGGVVYHYVAVMGYAVEPSGQRHVWIADSGFRPYGSWITLEQMAGLIPPKGYAYATATASKPIPEAPKPAPEPAPSPEPGRPSTPVGIPVEEIAALILDQLAGFRKPDGTWDFSGHEMLGVDQDGKPLTLVEALAAVHAKVDEVLRILKGDK